jgi:hypothetical protein
MVRPYKGQALSRLLDSINSLLESSEEFQEAFLDKMGNMRKTVVVEVSPCRSYILHSPLLSALGIRKICASNWNYARGDAHSLFAQMGRV